MRVDFVKGVYGHGFCHDLALDRHPAMPMQCLLCFVDAKVYSNRISHAGATCSTEPGLAAGRDAGNSGRRKHRKRQTHTTSRTMRSISCGLPEDGCPFTTARRSRSLGRDWRRNRMGSPRSHTPTRTAHQTWESITICSRGCARGYCALSAICASSMCARILDSLLTSTILYIGTRF